MANDKINNWLTYYTEDDALCLDIELLNGTKYNWIWKKEETTTPDQARKIIEDVKQYLILEFTLD